MAPEYEEADFIEFCGDICVGNGKISHPYRVFSLHMKRHCCRLVIISPVFRIIIAIHAYLHVKHTECGESQKHVAVDAKSRQRNHILIG